MGAIEIFKKMSDDNNCDLKVSPLSNVKGVKQGKDGWGELTIAIPNESVTDFVLGSYIGGLLFVHKIEFDKYKENEE